jgi:hypothetical protein
VPSPAPAPDFAPPRFTDPRRLGAVVGLAGAFVFVSSDAPDPHGLLPFLVTFGAYAVIVAAVLRLFWRPRWLGTFQVPRTRQILVYLACVVGELALIRIGSLRLQADGHLDARPALIAAVVGLHFIPFAWAFRERMFYLLGGALVVLGIAGLGLQLTLQPSGDGNAARWAAVAAGWTMAVLLLAFGSGVFARRAPEPTARSQTDPPAS